MNVFSNKNLHTWLISACCILSYSNISAAPFFYPGVTAPYQMVTAGDTLTIQSGTMETPTGNSAPYTVNFPLTPVAATTTVVTVDAGATLTYSGSLNPSNVVNSAKSSALAFTENVINNGTIDAGTGLIAIKMTNGIGATANNIVNITNNGAIVGGIFTNGLLTAVLNVNGSATISDTITMTPVTGGTSTFNVGPTTAANFTLEATLSNITTTHVFPASTLNLNFTTSEMGTFTIDAGATMSVNAALSSLTATNIQNAGIVNVSANITKTLGAFNTTAGGITNIREAVTLNLASYTVSGTGIHNSVLTDYLNYGNATFNIAPTLNIVTITYEGGYFQSGVYTLVTSTGAMPVPTLNSLTTDSLFINTSTHLITPVYSSPTTITTTLLRTTFQTYATNELSENVAVALEYLGNHNPSAATLNILNAVNRSTTAAQVENALEQLAPLVSAPLHAFDVQNQVLEQVEFRLAAIRNGTAYFAGDAENDNALWIRGFTDQANQQPVDSILGYYATTGGVAFGLDRSLDEKYLLGLAGSYGISNVTDKVNTNSYTKVKSYQAMLYGTYNFKKNKYVDWIIGVAANSYTAKRYININTLNLIANAKYSGQQFSTRATWGQDFSYADFLQVTPLSMLQYTFAKQYTYTEDGAPGANLNVNRSNSNVIQLGLGSKISTPIALSKSIFVPEIHGMFLYNVLNGNQNSFSTFTQGGTTIASNMNLSRTALRIGAALTFVVTGSVELVFNYDYEVRDRYTDNAFFLNLKYIL